ncbi:leucine-, isoleucine-, valine-, threonine-, and alanine-binding protein precursor [Clostridium homopropionicum DSM 5847]|uniref:Leucine-, isoleucine-, valine-, threonine-, and alanine-binding protein n=1 Tax=Clostridium homopropionicum DSM 5847 TaxID=1121318 RepID=A0A0L6ZBR8_9CLOT|nr:ABC transporter substrate-binding protein [Clostridium homopropionicum]KOA20416.1 leucine-, isoleucine-, valine-, threonine-, and alanine-binding protein precursor [Clostridium homopropionicum DSM 5847]SFG34197.1 amino acid/amide ABC transporter substrate-binding protein, HAAT family [Clostridium homopropionicum]
MKTNKVKHILLWTMLISNFVYFNGCIKKSETIKIGVLGTMSGINSDLSVSGRRGVELAADEINKAGGINGRKVQLIVKDDKNDLKVALQMNKEFIDENVGVVIGPYTSGMIVNSIDYLRDKEILFLGPTISADSLSEKDDNFIRFIASTKEQAVVLTEMAKKNKNKKFAVIYDKENKGFNETLYNNFKDLLEKNSGQVIFTKGFSSNKDLNFSRIAKEIADSKADAVFIIANADNNATITQQIRKIECNIQIYSPLWSNTSDLITKGGSSVDGMYIVGAIDLNSKSKDFVDFKKSYLDKYGESPTFSSVYSYETSMALFEAIKMGPDFKPSTIKDNIIKIKNFKGLEGNYKIDKYGDNTRKYMIFRIEKGELRKVE